MTIIAGVFEDLLEGKDVQKNGLSLFGSLQKGSKLSKDATHYLLDKASDLDPERIKQLNKWIEHGQKTLDPKKEVLQDVRIGLGAVAPTAIRAKKAEAFLKGKRYSENLLEEAGNLAVEETDPIGDLRGSEEYKREMVAVMVKRGIREAFERARS